MLTLLLILLIGAAIPATITFAVVKLTEHEHTPRKLLKLILKFIITLGICFVLVAMWALGVFDGTNVAFQSSDNEWADSEILFKNRSFNGILFRFELYKLRCAPTAVLQRTTNRPHWYEFDNWFNSYSEPKWKVPYSNPLPNAASGYYPPVSMEHCANKGGTEQEMRDANAQAKQYILRVTP